MRRLGTESPIGFKGAIISFMCSTEVAAAILLELEPLPWSSRRGPPLPLEMAESMELEDTCEHHLLPLESIRVIGESIGLSSLDEEVCKRLTEDLEFRLKEVNLNKNE